MISTPSVGRPKRKPQEADDTQGADTAVPASIAATQQEAPALQLALQAIQTENEVLDVLSDSTEPGQASQPAVADPSSQPNPAEAAATPNLDAPKRKRVRRDNDAPWMRWFQAVPTVSQVPPFFQP